VGHRSRGGTAKTTLSESLGAAADKAEQRAAAAIREGDPEAAEIAMGSARQLR